MASNEFNFEIIVAYYFTWHSYLLVIKLEFCLQNWFLIKLEKMKFSAG